MSWGAKRGRGEEVGRKKRDEIAVGNRKRERETKKEEIVLVRS